MFILTSLARTVEGSGANDVLKLEGMRVIHGPITPKPSDSFYPGQFVFTLKLDERWGSCYTAHDGGFVKTVGYNKRLMLNMQGAYSGNLQK